MSTPERPRCARLRSLRRAICAALLRWVTESGGIAESRDPRMKEEELAALLAAIQDARRRGS